MDYSNQMKNFEIRLLTKNDMESYISDFQNMDLQCLSQTPEFSFLYQTIIEKFERLGADEKNMIIGAFSEKHLIGCIEIEDVDDKTDSAEFTIEVNERYRRKGVGMALLNEAIRLCQKVHYSCLTLMVRDDNEVARKLYKKCGFSEICRIENISETDSTKYFIQMSRLL